MFTRWRGSVSFVRIGAFFFILYLRAQMNFWPNFAYVLTSVGDVLCGRALRNAAEHCEFQRTQIQFW
jgi:hypothetical protein